MRAKHVLIIIMTVFLILSTLFIVIRYGQNMGTASLNDENEAYYHIHISMAVNQQNEKFWLEVYDGALEEAKKHSAYVELVGNRLGSGLSLNEQLNMSLYGNTDGVLLYPEDSIEVSDNIKKLRENDIPVVTMLRDSIETSRIAFVGINDYFLGQKYGIELKKYYAGQHGSSSDDYIKIAVLFPAGSFGYDSRDWFIQGLRNGLSKTKYRLSSKLVHENSGLSNVELILNEMLSGSGDIPELIICPDSGITEIAYHILEDRDLTGEIKLVGQGVSDVIKKAIIDEDILFSVTVDAKDLGRKSIRELMRYKKHGVANYTSNVELIPLDKKSKELADYAEKS